MKAKKKLKFDLRKTIFGLFFAFISIFSLGNPILLQNVYAEPENSNQGETSQGVDASADASSSSEQKNDSNSENSENEQNSKPKLLTGDDCKASLGSLGWLVCPATKAISEATDWLFDKIEPILVINPVSSEDGSPIYEIWKYCRGITNIVFIIFLLIVIYSQITGLGIDNYGIKKVLPKLIAAAILVNLSFLVCRVAVDLSNVVGSSLRGMFAAVAESAVKAAPQAAASDLSIEGKVAYAKMYSAMAGGTALAAAGAGIVFESGAIWMLIPTVLGAIVAVASGLITIALRQAVVALLIMISPLAMVANILPNTEQWFKKWKDLLFKMLIFYPMFSLLFGASNLAGFAIIASANDGFWVLVGTAVQVFPLFFSWSLMKMSGTFLGTINAKMRSLADKPLAVNRAWADSHRLQTRAYHAAYGRTPTAALQRYLGKRKALREATTTSLNDLNKKRQSIYVQRKIAAGFDGRRTKTTDGDLKPNRYTRIAKDVANASLEESRTKLDTEHVIDNYGNYFVKKPLRDGVRYNSARAGVSAEALRNARNSDVEYQRSKTGANEYLELYRAQMTREHDSEADIEFATDVFGKKVPENATQADWDNYNHYVLSAAGGLGDNRADRVRGKVIAKAAGVESAQRRDLAYVGAKVAVPKYDLRNMVVGYHHDSDGYAIDRNGNRIEEERGYLLNHDPSRLWWWENVDPVYGPYFDWKDENGNFITRVYKSNSPAVKEFMSNFDIPINDPVNNLYTILTGINGDPNSDDINMRFVGLGKFKTTLSKSLGVFKEKNSAFGPMVAEMAKKGLIKNSTDLNLAYIDSINKTTKPGNFNIQDGDAIKMMERIINKDKWGSVFRLDEIREYLNIDDNPLKGMDVDEHGNWYEIPAEEATDEQIMNTIERKLVAPGAVKMVAMMSRITPNTLDNQKISTLTKWAQLVETAERYWSNEIEESGYTGELRKVKRRFNDRINGRRGENGGANGNQPTDNAPVHGGGTNNNQPTDDTPARNEFNDPDNAERMRRPNHLMMLDSIYNESIDSMSFIEGVDAYCDQWGLEEARQEFHSQIDNTMMIEELYRIAVSVFSRYLD